MYTLNALIETYGRFSEGTLRQITVTDGSSPESVLMEFVDDCNFYLDSDSIAEEELTADEIINRLLQSNGDGCDYIFQLSINDKKYIDEAVNCVKCGL